MNPEAGVDLQQDPTQVLVDSLRKDYNDARPIIERARGRNPEKREQNKQAWKNFLSKVEGFGDKLFTAKEVPAVAAETIGRKGNEVWNRTVEGVKKHEKGVENKLSASFDRAYGFLDKVTDTMVIRTTEVGRETFNKLGNRLARPVLEGVVSAVKAVDWAQKTITDVRADVRDAFAEPIESAANRVLKVTEENPTIIWIKQGTELAKKSKEKKGWLLSIVERVGDRIEQARKVSTDLLIDSKTWKSKANQIRNEYKQSSLGRTEQVKAAQSVIGQFKEGIL